MPKIVITKNLASQTGGITRTTAEGGSVRELIDQLERQFPGIRHYLLDDQGALRRHVNLFVDGEPVEDRSGLSDPVSGGATLHVMQAHSGG